MATITSGIATTLIGAGRVAATRVGAELGDGVLRQDWVRYRTMQQVR